MQVYTEAARKEREVFKTTPPAWSSATSCSKLFFLKLSYLLICGHWKEGGSDRDLRAVNSICLLLPFHSHCGAVFCVSQAFSLPFEISYLSLKKKIRNTHSTENAVCKVGYVFCYNIVCFTIWNLTLVTWIVWTTPVRDYVKKESHCRMAGSYWSTTLHK